MQISPGPALMDVLQLAGAGLENIWPISVETLMRHSFDMEADSEAHGGRFRSTRLGQIFCSLVL